MLWQNVGQVFQDLLRGFIVPMPVFKNEDCRLTGRQGCEDLDQRMHHRMPKFLRLHVSDDWVRLKREEVQIVGQIGGEGAIDADDILPRWGDERIGLCVIGQLQLLSERVEKRVIGGRLGKYLASSTEYPDLRL